MESALGKKDKIDGWLIFFYFTLSTIGIVTIYSANYTEELHFFDLNTEHGKQLIYFVSGLVLAGIILLSPPKIFFRYSQFYYLGAVLLLLLVLVIGKQIGGAKSWIKLGAFSLQPSEFGKFATLLFLSAFLNILKSDLKNSMNISLALGIVGLPVLLIMLQPDAGSALVYGSIIFALYREGLPKGFLLLIPLVLGVFFMTLALPIWLGLLILVLIYFLTVRKKYKFYSLRKNVKILSVFVLIALTFLSIDYVYNNLLKPHQRNRIDLILGKIDDPTDLGYNLEQSEIAIANGGIFGQGFLAGTQTNFDFIPKQSTDFIFCALSEEWGALGVFIVMGLFTCLILRVLALAEKQRSTFSRVYGYGVAGFFTIHVFINIAMTVGLMPVIGIPLPFFSYGGSSFWSFTILLFIFIRLATAKKEVI